MCRIEPETNFTSFTRASQDMISIAKLILESRLLTSCAGTVFATQHAHLPHRHALTPPHLSFFKKTTLFGPVEFAKYFPFLHLNLLFVSCRQSLFAQASSIEVPTVQLKILRIIDSTGTYIRKARKFFVR